MKKRVDDIKWIRIILFVLLVLALVIIAMGYKGLTGKVVDILNGFYN